MISYLLLWMLRFLKPSIIIPDFSVPTSLRRGHRLVLESLHSSHSRATSSQAWLLLRNIRCFFPPYLQGMLNLLPWLSSARSACFMVRTHSLIFSSTDRGSGIVYNGIVYGPAENHRSRIKLEQRKCSIQVHATIYVEVSF